MKQESEEKGYILAYDVKSLPKMNTMKEIARGAIEKGIVIWDSSLGGSKPKIMHLGGDKNIHLKDVQIVDLFNI